MNMQSIMSKEGEPMSRQSSFLSRLRSRWTARSGKTLDQNRQGIRGDEGATIVEFALSCGILCMMLFGIVEVSLAVYTYDFVSEAARDGARYAIVRGTKCTGMTDCNATSAQIQTHVQSLNYPAINGNNLTVTATWLSAAAAPPNMVWSSCSGSGCNKIGNAVNVQVQYPFQLSIPFWKSVTINLSNSSQMVISQ
jgi:Flp pilus assembly protein TadG